METQKLHPWALPLGVLAAAALGAGIQDANGAYSATALACVSVALVACALALFLPRASMGASLQNRASRRIAVLAVMATLAYQFGTLVTSPVAIYARMQPGLNPHVFSAALAAGAVMAGFTLTRSPWVRGAAVLGLVVAHAVAATFILRASPNPHIDVFVFQRDALQALVSGHNPFGLDFPNIYGDTRFYGDGVVVNGRLDIGFPYPPLSLLLALPGHLIAGDFRFSQLAAWELSALGMAWLGRRGWGPAMAAVFLFTPRSFFILEQSWTEPFVVLLLITLLVVADRWPKTRGPLFGLLLAVKQHLVLLALVASALPKRWTTERSWMRWGAIAVAVGAAVTLPWMVTAPSGFLKGVVLFQFRQPFREESLSFLALLARDGGPRLGSWVAFALLVPTAWAVKVRAARSLAGFSFSAALLYLVFFAFNKQAFCNYYAFALGLVCAAVAALSAPETREPSF